MHSFFYHGLLFSDKNRKNQPIRRKINDQMENDLGMDPALPD